MKTRNEIMRSEAPDDSLCKDCLNAFNLNYKCSDAIRKFNFCDGAVKKYSVVSCTGYDKEGYRND